MDGSAGDASDLALAGVGPTIAAQVHGEATVPVTVLSLAGGVVASVDLALGGSVSDLKREDADVASELGWRPGVETSVSLLCDSFDIDGCIQQLRDPGRRYGAGVTLATADLKRLCEKARNAFLAEPMLLEIGAPVTVVGNTMGYYDNLLRILAMAGEPGETNYLFLGGYVNTGRLQTETIALLLLYKLKFPGRVSLLRGNHECMQMGRIYNFYAEMKRRYDVKLFKQFCQVFNCMPVAALIGGKVLCMHGGLSPELRHLDQIRRLPRPVETPSEGLMCDLLWSDPAQELNGFGENARGVSFTFGADVVAQALKDMALDRILRTHEIIEAGIETFAEDRLVTVWSIPNYRDMMDNRGAIVRVAADLTYEPEFFQ